MSPSTPSQTLLAETFLATDRVRWSIDFRRELRTSLRLSTALSAALLVLGAVVHPNALPSVSGAIDAIAMGLVFSGLASIGYTLATVGLAPTLRSLAADPGYDFRVRAAVSTRDVQALFAKP